MNVPFDFGEDGLSGCFPICPDHTFPDAPKTEIETPSSVSHPRLKKSQREVGRFGPRFRPDILDQTHIGPESPQQFPHRPL